MIFRVNYTGGMFYDIELYDTMAVRKWKWAHNINLKHGHQGSRRFREGHSILSYEGYTDRSYYKHQYDVDRVRKGAVARINKAIEKVNSSIKGDKFPYRATMKMGFTRTQKLHRAFTTGMTTGHCFNHKLTREQLEELYPLKYSGNGLKLKMKELTEKKFIITDIRKFEYWMEEINQGVHDFEPTIKSPRADKAKRDGTAAKSLCHNPILAKDRINFQVIELTEDDIKESMPYIGDADVFLNSQIFGKTYIETYNENDPPYEFDVKNIEHVNGAFFTIPYDKDKFTKYLTDSDWTKWLEEYNVPQHLSHPVPIGKIINSKLPVKIERFYDTHKVISTQFISDLEVHQALMTYTPDPDTIMYERSKVQNPYQ